jgi:hypothetical protein
VVTADIPGAFMQADMDEIIHMKLEGPLAKQLVQVIQNKYKEYLNQERGCEIIYIQLKKALYGILQAALLFWEDLSGKLLEWGFILKPYDNCVANKIIDGKQCTALWHVDNITISHMNHAVVEHVLGLLEKQYGKEKPLIVSPRKGT